MKTSTEIGSASKFIGEEKAVEEIAKAGFDAWDFSMFNMCRYDWNTRSAVTTDHPLAGNNYIAFARRLRQIGLDNGITCNQSHAPFPVSCPEIRSLLKRSIECTAEAGGKICVVHPDNNKSPEENAEIYAEILPFAKSCGVKIATENMWNLVPSSNCSIAFGVSLADAGRKRTRRFPSASIGFSAKHGCPPMFHSTGGLFVYFLSPCPMWYPIYQVPSDMHRPIN